jgi:glutaredoxin
MRTILHLLLVMFLMSVFQVQAAKLYKWVDEDGNVSYHAQPPRDDNKYKVEEKDFGRQLESSRKSGELKNRNRKFPITLYMMPKCATCDLVRQYLISKKLPNSELNVEGNTAMQAELKRVSGKLEVPVVTVGKGLVRGYSLEELNKQLIEAGYLDQSEAIQSQPDTAAKQ